MSIRRCLRDASHPRPFRCCRQIRIWPLGVRRRHALAIYTPGQHLRWAICTQANICDGLYLSGPIFAMGYIYPRPIFAMGYIKKRRCLRWAIKKRRCLRWAVYKKKDGVFDGLYKKKTMFAMTEADDDVDDEAIDDEPVDVEGCHCELCSIVIAQQAETHASASPMACVAHGAMCGRFTRGYTLKKTITCRPNLKVATSRPQF